jgi:predicted transposase/invertase (TIGR01784 family)
VSNHDSPYKQLFRVPGMVTDLLKLVAKDSDWLSAVDFSSFEIVSSNFLGENWQERESDVIWRFKIGGRDVFLYLMLEFQSTHDWKMPVRMMGYVAMLYQALIDQKHIKEKTGLPPILPIVIYNGQDNWTSATSLQFQDTPEALKAYLPSFNFWLIDEKNYADITPDLDNLVSALFLMENQRSPENLLNLIDVYQVVWHKRPTEARFFNNWLKWNLFERKGIKTPEHFTLLEKREMLADVIDREYAEREERGVAKGLAKGKAEGKAEGWKAAQTVIAKTMKGLNLPLATIVTTTGLSEEEVLGL